MAIISKGTVFEYDSGRGFGRIVDSLTGESLVVYANYVDSDIRQSLSEGQSVEFEIEYHRNENWAVHVRLG